MAVALDVSKVELVKSLEVKDTALDEASITVFAEEVVDDETNVAE